MSNRSTPSVRDKSVITSIATKSLLDSKRLFYFYHVARLGSLTTAETVLDVAQSAISRQLQQLEAELGEQLLERTGRGVKLTEAGELLFRQATSILGEMASTVELIQQIKKRPASGSISIASPPTFSNLYMPQVVKRFVDMYPHIRLSAYEASSGQVYDYLATGQVDLAIVLHASNSQKLKMQKLVEEPLLVVAHASHPLARKKQVERNDLPLLDLLLPVAVNGSREIIEHYCQQGGITLDPMIRLDSLGMIKAVLREGKHATILPRLACAQEIDSGEFICRPLMPVLKRTVYVASLRDREVTSHMRSMLKEIAAVVHGKVET